jgi:hypothetical protein
MNRRLFFGRLTATAVSAGSVYSGWWGAASAMAALGERIPGRFIEAATARDWLAKWEPYCLGETSARYCDKGMGEELGWLVSPFLNGFYYGYLATQDTKWIDLLVNWTDSVLKRAAKEPDGFVGWPNGDGGGNQSAEYSADSLMGEGMMFTPVLLMAATIAKTPALTGKYGETARRYVEVGRQLFNKWDTRDCWREVKDGGVWVVPDFGVDKKSPDKWSAGYAQRKTTGFSNPANKQNLIACWLVALAEATGDAVPRARAEAWWRLMRSRMTMRESGKYFVWNYWEPAGPWDFKAGGSPKLWIGVHPNGGYYDIDVGGMVTAYEHGLVFQKADIERLIATNRDFMWDQKVDDAKFQCIDGGAANPRWPDTPGVLWTSLAPYDDTLRKIFVANFKPARWGGIEATPWALSQS